MVRQVWTTHAWLAEGFRSSGLHVPVRLMPLGTTAPRLDPPWHASAPGPAFTFLVLANLQPRKAVAETAEAFVAAFGDSDRVRLRVHGKWGDVDVIRRMDSFRRFRNVRVTLGTLTDAEMAALWREADCVVSLSKGEGWGLVPREALALGLPVIVSALPCWDDLRGHSAQGGLGEGRAWFVETAEREEAVYGFTAEDTGRFFTVAPAEVRLAMRRVHAAYAGAPRRPPVAADVSPSWAEASAQYAAELDKETLVFSRSLGTACGISTYTYDFLGGLPRAAFARSWAEVFSLTLLLRPRVLHVQHEHGLHWDEREFLMTLGEYQRAHPGVALVVTLHTLHLFDPARVLFYSHLARLAHVVVLNERAGRLLPFPVTHVEHGVPPYRAPPSPVLRLRHAATFGFWDEEKRHEDLCALAEEAGLAIDYFGNPPAKLGQSQCEGLVTFRRGFLTSPALVRALSEYAVLVFLRRPNHLVYAVSGSARLALGAGVPVVCEASPHFDDLAGAVDLAPPGRVAARLLEVATNATLAAELVGRQRAFAARWGAEEVRRRHLELYAAVTPKPVPAAAAAGSGGGGGGGSDADEAMTALAGSEEARRQVDAHNVFADGRVASLQQDRPAAAPSSAAAREAGPAATGGGGGGGGVGGSIGGDHSELRRL